MRELENMQLQLGKVDISKIKFDEKSRDDIPKILKGLQHIYINSDIRTAVFNILEKNIFPGIDKSNGRPGMELWKIFVLRVLRLDLNYDYDRVRELVNHHNTIRAMLGHPKEDEFSYQIQTIVYYPTDINLLFDAMRKVITLTARLSVSTQ